MRLTEKYGLPSFSPNQTYFKLDDIFEFLIFLLLQTGENK